MQRQNSTWPVLKRYDEPCLLRIAMPLGGIGTGTVSLGGRGDLRDWEIVNKPAKGFIPARGFRDAGPFFALFTSAGKKRAVRCLEGVIPGEAFEGSSGCAVANHGWPRFRECSFLAAYPLAQVLLSDPAIPVDVRIEAFNPLIPGDADASGIPAAVLRFVLRNKTAKTVNASVCGTLVNFIGFDGTEYTGVPKTNRNEFRQRSGVSGLFLHSRELDRRSPEWGTIALATTAGTGLSHRTAWADLSWGDSLLDFWDDFSSDGKLEDRGQGGIRDPKGSLAVSLRVPPRQSRAVTFLLTWHFPNRQTWTPKKAEQAAPAGGCGGSCADPNWIGNYYTTRYADAWDVAVRTAASLSELESRTVEFARAFCEADIPGMVKEAALFNLPALRSQTSFRTADGNFYGWEGCGDRAGCCHGSCTHVWNYEQATAFLFGRLARQARRIEFLHATDDTGRMSFRINLPLERAREFGTAAADGQMGTIMRLYREWRLSGDDAFLREVWARARKAMEFCWIRGGWDADRDGVMEGCQHNTMDVEYYGPNPEMGTWYLGALRAVEEMARHVGDGDFAATCRDLFTRGSAWLDANLLHGEYYEQKVVPPAGEQAIARGLWLNMGSKSLADPDMQLGAGCLVDQLVGQYMAHICGLGYLLNKGKIRKTLKSIIRHNFRRSMFDHFNHLRTYALGEESGLLLATWPRGRRPRRPFPYCNEVWTGLEYVAAVGMFYEGMDCEGLECVKAVRDRHDGRKRNPFDEPECGHHYARAMASWGAVLALTGFHYSGVSGTIEFAAAGRKSRKTVNKGGTDGTKPAVFFWSNGYAWGTFRQRPSRRGIEVVLSVLGGSIKISRISLAGFGSAEVPVRILDRGAKVECAVKKS